MRRGLRRLLLVFLGLGGALVAACVSLVIATPQPPPRPPATPYSAPRLRASLKPALAPVRPAPAARLAAASASTALASAACAAPSAFAAAAGQNAASMETAGWSPFGRLEAGWEVYAPLVARAIGTGCAPGSPGFAAALARWRGAPERPTAGVLDAATLQAIGGALLNRRPFVRQTAHGGCPPPPAPAQVEAARPEEGYGGKRVSLRADALAAFRRMRAAARAELAEVAVDPRTLTLVSGFRDPVEEAARCAARACDGLTRARCSAHRTGLALDLDLAGGAEGADPTSSDDANRLGQSRSPAYRWMVANADRFGFVPYPFEPWHWEWAGAPAG